MNFNAFFFFFSRLRLVEQMDNRFLLSSLSVRARIQNVTKGTSLVLSLSPLDDHG